jgi:hypothetical protein
MSSAAYHFLPWARSGMPASIAEQDPLGPSLAARASIPVTVRLASSVPGRTTATDDVGMPLRLYGPGDVIGIDPREIVRTEPRHLTPDFPPHLLAAIEFDRPDFPWLFTPAAPNQNRLRPWIVLVVVPRGTASIGQEPNRPLPVLRCPLEELPDLTHSWLWAHAQFAGASTSNDLLPGALTANPAQTVSRLLCPRRLLPGTGTTGSYLACLVPAFAVGRMAGLGDSITAEEEAKLEPAWDLAQREKAVELPVYYSWEFTTAQAEGDFEDLVDKLQMPGASAAPRPTLMDLSNPGRGVISVPGASMGLPSALRSQGAAVAGWPSSLGKTFQDFQASLTQVLRTPSGHSNKVAPPVYGSIQAIGTAPDAGRRLDQTVPLWLQELNRDPRYRVAAALGAQVVREQQESLVSEAWQQAGEVADANRWLAQKQLAREVSLSIYEKRLMPLSSGALQQITAPVIAPAAVTSAARLESRMTTFAARADAIEPAEAQVAPTTSDQLLDAVATSAFRRIARPESTLARHTAVATSTDEPLSGMMASLSSLMTDLVEAPTLTKIQLMPDLAVVQPEIITTATTMMTVTEDATTPAAATSELLKQLDPNITYAREAVARIDTTAMAAQPAASVEPLAPLRVTPAFSQPMYEPLRDMFRDMLLPGLDNVPNNSVMLLDPDPAFIEAYMAGLNDELTRELLWREFPTDLRGTYFRQFWDIRAQLKPDATEAEREEARDIPPLAGWTARLGDNMKPSRGKNLVVLLIKGDLLVRFPTTVIFAARAKWTRSGTTDGPPAVVDEATAPVFPSLRVDPVPGVRLLGFDIAGGSEAITGGALPPQDPGWFIVIQEHPFEPRFGLNSNRTDALTTWRKLAWPDIGLREDSSYIDPTGKVPVLVDKVRDPDKLATWGRTGADMAYIFLQQAYRLEVHAGHWLS